MVEGILSQPGVECRLTSQWILNQRKRTCMLFPVIVANE